MEASSPSTDEEKATLKAKISAQLEVDPDSGMKNFKVTSQTVRRGLLNSRRKLLAETWTVRRSPRYFVTTRPHTHEATHSKDKMT